MLQEYKQDIYACARCGDCRESVKIESAHKGINKVCPVKEQLGFDSFTARGKLMILREVLEGKNIDEDIADVFYSCLECGNCEHVCISQLGEGIDIPSIVEAFRSQLTEMGFTRKEHAPLIASIKNYDNPWMMPRYRKAKWVSDYDIPDTGEILFFAGCSCSLLNPHIAQSVIKIFDTLNIPVAYLGKKEACCGSILKRVGAATEFEKIKQKNLNLFEKSGAKTIVTTCAGCYRTLKLDYDIAVPVKHITEFLDEYRKEQGLQLTPFNKKVTYHDPCHLGRHCNVYMPPRNLIKAIPDIDFKEMQRTKEFSWCCGSGAGIKTYDPALAVNIAKGRVQEAQTRLILSACPYCEANLKDADAQVMDIVEVYADILTPGSAVQKTSTTAEQFMAYLQDHTVIFSEIKKGGVLQYLIEGQPFTVEQTKEGTAITAGEHDNPDIIITITHTGVNQLMDCKTKKEYLKMYKYLYKKTDDLDFEVKANMFTMARRGYVSWAKKAGLLSI